MYKTGTQPLDPRAKNKCVICLSSIIPHEYLQMGNFCPKCTHDCNNLALVYPYETHHYTQFQQERFNHKKESYDRLCNLFTNRLMRDRKTTQ